MKELKDLRKKIDKIDSKLIELLSDRFNVSRKIMNVKRKENLDFYDKEREIELLKNKENKADKIGLDRSFIKKIFQLILKESKNIQEKNI